MAQAQEVDWDLKALQEIFSAMIDEGLLRRRPKVHMRVDESATVEIELDTATIAISRGKDYSNYVAEAKPKYDCQDPLAVGCPMAFSVGASGKTPKEAIAALRERVKEMIETVRRLDRELTHAVADEDSDAFTMVRDAIDATEWSIYEIADALGVKKEG